MTIKTLAAAVALVLIPGFVLAEGCSHNKEAAMSCADGTSYDVATGTCTPISS